MIVSALCRMNGPLFAAIGLLGTTSAHGQARIRALTSVIAGHQVGGVTIDLIGNIYVADFGDEVWKITPEGKRTPFASGFYGSSGNAIDRDGNLLQASYYGNSISKVDRLGHVTAFVNGGLDRPVGIAIDGPTGDVYVANCGGNSIARITGNRTVSTFAASPLFKCPNGIAFDRNRNLYVVNFGNNAMLKVDRNGVVTPFASVSAKGLAHLCFKDDRFYVTAYQSHEIYEVELDGSVRRIVGNGRRGNVDGSGGKARLSFPNGIACDPWAQRLYINEDPNISDSALPRRAIVRVITLGRKQ